MIKQPWKTLGFIWSGFWTLVGLLWALLLGASWLRWEPEDWSLHYALPEGGRGRKFFARFNVGAQTVGSVIIYGQADWGAEGGILDKHERSHVRQGMRFGVFNPFLYALASLLAWAYGQDIYRGNEAEEQARAESGQVPQPSDIAPKDHSGGKL